MPRASALPRAPRRWSAGKLAVSRGAVGGRRSAVGGRRSAVGGRRALQTSDCSKIISNGTVSVPAFADTDSIFAPDEHSVQARAICCQRQLFSAIFSSVRLTFHLPPNSQFACDRTFTFSICIQGVSPNNFFGILTPCDFRSTV